MTSYQKLKQRIRDLEVDRQRLLSDPEYFLKEHLKVAIRKDIAERWLYDPTQTGELKTPIWESLFKDQEQDANDNEGQS